MTSEQLRIRLKLSPEQWAATERVDGFGARVVEVYALKDRVERKSADAQLALDAARERAARAPHDPAAVTLLKGVRALVEEIEALTEELRTKQNAILRDLEAAVAR
jgi:predicted  nucleic acid-binding Zn-ribbon protein